LIAASNLAQAHTDLGDYRVGRALSEDTLARYRRVLGDDHPDTLRSANGLANTLHALGDQQTARTLHQDTLARRRRRVLGPGRVCQFNGSVALSVVTVRSLS
jgi:Tetratricopeptide repeat